MALQLKFDMRAIQWDRVTHILKAAGMAHYTSVIHQRAFENSSTVVRFEEV